MDPMKLFALLRGMPLNRETAGALMPLVGKVGAKGAVAMARAYLGPVAREVEEKCCRELNQYDPCRDEQPPPPPPPPDPVPDPSPNDPPPPDPSTDPSTDPNTGTLPPPDPALDPNAPPPPSIAEPPRTHVGGDRTGIAGLHQCDLALIAMAVNKFFYEAGELALHNPDVRSDGKLPQFKLDEHGSPPALSLTHVVAARRLWNDLRNRRAADEAAAAFEPVTPRARLQLARAQRYGALNRYAYTAPTPLNRVPR